MRRRVYQLSLILFFVIPWDAAIVVGGLGAVSRIVGLALVGAWLVEQLVTNHFPRFLLFHTLVFSFVLWNGASLAWTLDQSSGITQFLTYVQLGMMVIVIWDVYRSEAAIRQGSQWFVYGCFVSAGSGIYNFLTAETTLASEVRVATTNFNPNATALILVLAIPIAWTLASSSEDSRMRLVNYAMLPMASLGIALSGSRTALIAIVPVAFFIVVRMLRSTPSAKLGLLVVIAVSILIVQVVVPDSAYERYTTIGDELSSRDFTGRAKAWEDGIDAWLMKPLVGVGLASYDDVTTSGLNAHNIILQVAVETGVVGLVLFTGLLGAAFGAAIRLRRAGEGLWLTLLSAWLLGSMSHTWHQEKFTWLLLSLTVSAADVRFSGASGLSYRGRGKARQADTQEPTDTTDEAPDQAEADTQEPTDTTDEAEPDVDDYLSEADERFSKLEETLDKLSEKLAEFGED